MASYFRNPNFVFFGTPDFAAIILEKLISAGFVPTAVICNPDRPVGRKKIITPPPVKQLIANDKWQIEILQPNDLEAIRSKLKALAPDLFIVAAYAKILPKEIIDIPRRGAIGVHPSLLPKYRGPTPIQSAILHGESQTGVTLYLLDEKVDHGSTIANRKAPIANRNYKELDKELAEMAADLLVRTLPKFLAGSLKPEPQNEAGATYTKKFQSVDGFVSHKDLRSAEDGGREALIIERKIRALNPEPGVYILDESGRRVKLLEAELSQGRLKLKKIQEEGKKPELVAESSWGTR